MRRTMRHRMCSGGQPMNTKLRRYAEQAGYTIVGVAAEHDGQGVFHEFTQESVDAMMDSYKETLESIKKGVLYSKDDGDGDTYSMIPPTEDVVSSYSVDVTKDNGKTVHIGDYSTVEELDKAISDAVKNGQLTQEEADSVQK